MTELELCSKQEERSRNEWKLIERGLNVSESKIWNVAKKEWEIINVYMDYDYDTCTCDHYPIKEIIIVKNIYNNNELTIGNCCINKFFDFDFKGNKFFGALAQKKINQTVIDRGYKDRVLNEWEYTFLSNIWRKRKFTAKQLEKGQSLGRRLLKHYIKNIDIDENNTITDVNINTGISMKYMYTITCKECKRSIDMFLEPGQAYGISFKKHNCGTYLDVEIKEDNKDNRQIIEEQMVF